MMVSDGFGPASQTYGRSFWQYQNNYTEGTQTWLDEILVGASRTRSSNSLVTDSAAGATAFSCAKKSFNAAIAGKHTHETQAEMTRISGLFVLISTGVFKCLDLIYSRSRGYSMWHRAGISQTAGYVDGTGRHQQSDARYPRSLLGSCGPQGHGIRNCCSTDWRL